MGVLPAVAWGIAFVSVWLFCRAAVAARRHPVTVGALVIGAACWRAGALGWLLVAAGLVVLALVVLRQRYPSLWRCHVTDPRWKGRRRRHVATSWPCWCDRVGLTVVALDQRTGVRTVSTPALRRLRWAPGSAVLTGHVMVLVGQTVDDLVNAAEKLAAAAGAARCRVRATSINTAELAFFFADPLGTVLRVPAPGSSDDVDLFGLPVGLREDSGPWRLPLAGTHVLVAGATGAGKGSVIWSLLAALAPAIGHGRVQVWAVDGKAGMELSAGAPLFARFATTVADGVDLLEDAAAVMRERAGRMAGYARTHVATSEEPLLVVLVDEVALLTAYEPDRKLRERAEKALAVIATQGRAPGVALVVALQDPRKEVLSLRGLFPTRVGMRLEEKTQVDMVLGDGACAAGAACHQILDTSPGVAYVKVDGVREPVRVRAFYLDDADIAALAVVHPAPQGSCLVVASTLRTAAATAPVDATTTGAGHDPAVKSARPKRPRTQNAQAEHASADEATADEAEGAVA